MAAVAALAAVVADLALGTGTGTAVGAGAVVGVAGAAATVAKVTASHLPAASRRAGALGQPGGPEQLRLAWLTALEVRGIRPFFDQQRVLIASTGAKKGAPQLRRTDKSAAARRRSVLEQSFGQLPEPVGPFAGRRQELLRVAQWVHAARASTETRPTVVVLHGAPGSGRSTLAVRAAHELKDQFRGACVVDLRGDSPEESPLTTRDALLHLLNRLGAPREQLLFRERSSQDQQVRRLAELYHQHLTGLPVTIVLDDASDVEQVRTLVPERSDSLVLVTARKPLDLPADLPAWVHQLRGGAAGPRAGAEELLKRGGTGQPRPRTTPNPPTSGSCAAASRWRCASRARRSARAHPAGSPRTWRRTARSSRSSGCCGCATPTSRTPARRLLRRLALAGRASLGAAAAAALLATDEPEATRHLEALSRAGLIDHVRGSRYRLHDLVRAFAQARLLDEEEPAERTAAQERLIANYAELADSVIRLVDGKTSTRADQFGPHGFTSLDAALRWLDDESSFITAALRHAEGVDQAAVLNLLGALCDYCLLRGDLYRLGEISELTQAVDQGLLVRSVQWRTGIAARQLGELDKARTHTGLGGGPLLRGAPRRGRGPGALLARDHPPPPGQSHGGGGEAPGGPGPPGLPRPRGGPRLDDARAGGGGAGPRADCARRSTC